MTENPVLVETIDDHIGLVTFNRPAKLNALSYDVVRLLDEALTKFEDDPEIRCIVITGAGEKAFSSGADIHEQVKISPEELQERLERRAQWLWHLANAAKPTIGAINGLAYGGGAVLATTLISGSAVSVLAFASWRGVRADELDLDVAAGCRLGASQGLLFTAWVVSPEEALQLGLLNKVVPSEELLAAAVEMRRQIAANTPEMVHGLKGMLLADIGGALQKCTPRRSRSDDDSPAPAAARSFKDFLAGRPDGKA